MDATHERCDWHKPLQTIHQELLVVPRHVRPTLRDKILHILGMSSSGWRPRERQTKSCSDSDMSKKGERSEKAAQATAVTGRTNMVQDEGRQDSSSDLGNSNTNLEQRAHNGREHFGLSHVAQVRAGRICQYTGIPQAARLTHRFPTRRFSRCPVIIR